MTAGRAEPLVHHELCFGCGRANLFGLLAELRRRTDRSVTGRCFLKQDHQGAGPGVAHEGLLAAALSEAMSFACGPSVRLSSLELSVLRPVAVGSYLELEAAARDLTDGGFEATATATFEDDSVATARASYEPLTREG